MLNINSFVSFRECFCRSNFHPCVRCDILANEDGVLTLQERKPCYRKDDSAMRPIYGYPGKFRESLATPTATFPEIVNGLLL